jgi:hypothetical protein
VPFVTFFRTDTFQADGTRRVPATLTHDFRECLLHLLPLHPKGVYLSYSFQGQDFCLRSWHYHSVFGDSFR